jgi:hypothetical protein
MSEGDGDTAIWTVWTKRGLPSSAWTGRQAPHFPVSRGLDVDPAQQYGRMVWQSRRNRPARTNRTTTFSRRTRTASTLPTFGAEPPPRRVGGAAAPSADQQFFAARRGSRYTARDRGLSQRATGARPGLVPHCAGGGASPPDALRLPTRRAPFRLALSSATRAACSFRSLRHPDPYRQARPRNPSGIESRFAAGCNSRRSSGFMLSTNASSTSPRRAGTAYQTSDQCDGYAVDLRLDAGLISIPFGTVAITRYFLSPAIRRTARRR